MGHLLLSHLCLVCSVLGEFPTEPVTSEAHPYSPQARARRRFLYRRPLRSRDVAVLAQRLQQCSFSFFSCTCCTSGWLCKTLYIINAMCVVSLTRLRPVRERRTRVKHVTGLTGLDEAFRHTLPHPPDTGCLISTRQLITTSQVHCERVHMVKVMEEACRPSPLCRCCAIGDARPRRGFSGEEVEMNGTEVTIPDAKVNDLLMSADPNVAELSLRSTCPSCANATKTCSAPRGVSWDRHFDA
ncbi:hypothetical protein Taro_050062 [Colocasia esculenta]|uniref:Secreted protein n=1 Tax=Colocasia esculenta TaxID=4460 RepID=A0A843XCS7_COLES|nr:hypothetical protein [Colocasia esculenta]